MHADLKNKKKQKEKKRNTRLEIFKRGHKNYRHYREMLVSRGVADLSSDFFNPRYLLFFPLETIFRDGRTTH